MACGGNTDDGKCTYGAPTAIFEGVEGLEQHFFEVNGQTSVEKVAIPSMNMNIELYQSGCDQIEQEYRILLQEPYELNTPAEVCALHIANILHMISEKAPQQLGALQQWANAIRADSKRMAYNEPILLTNSGIRVQIDKLHQTNSAILSLVLSQ
jgi:hypothetical protein